MNRNLAIVIVAAMIIAIIANYVLAGPNWVALVAVLISGVAVSFGFGAVPAQRRGEWDEDVTRDLDTNDLDTNDRGTDDRDANPISDKS